MKKLDLFKPTSLSTASPKKFAPLKANALTADLLHKIRGGESGSGSGGTGSTESDCDRRRRTGGG